MKPVTFIDLEVHPRDGAILDFGAVKDSGGIFHSKSKSGFIEFLRGSEYIAGHNIISHDLQYILVTLKNAGFASDNIIDTLHLSALLFPRKPYHSLVKDEKLQSDDINNPLSDAKKCKELFDDEVAAFSALDDSLKEIYYLLLKDQDEYGAFFRYLHYQSTSKNPVYLIQNLFAGEICERADLQKFIDEAPVALAYSLAIINVKDRFSVTPPWVLKSYPRVDLLTDYLRNRPCIEGCAYCEKTLDAHRGLKTYFGFDSFRTYEGEPLQEKAVEAAIDNKSLLVVFPTGGGKSLAFQLPALISGENVKGLTVVISPLQSLMKDQVDNLEKVGITDAVTINGLLDPIERAKSIERVQDGSAAILYISPESLRSRSIEHLLKGRKIVRFVIDEAHCFSAWGQDFRVDYLYIGDFIKKLQEKKNLTEGIPVSCFTATAKQMVMEDIRGYFKDKLGLNLETFTTEATRTNLRYKVIEKQDQEEKYLALRHLLQEKDCPAIVYVSRTRKAYKISERLNEDGFNTKPYHGQMDKKEKSENQDAFIAGEVSVIVATSAFGMGVDKKDVGMVVHFEISDSLENYIQEAGRAGRDENINADCYILYCEEDLDKHFILLNQTRINIKEIQQVWKALKEVTSLRLRASQSALEIARKAGWDDTISDIETRVRTAVAALEESGYIRRGQNMPKVFADSILCRNAREAIDKINASSLFEAGEKESAIRIIRKLIAGRSRSLALGEDEDAESRVDYISDHLGIEKGKVIGIINLMRQEGILADAKDLTAYIQRDEKTNRSLQILESYSSIEKYLTTVFEEQEATFNIKELNEEAEIAGCKNVTPNKINVLLNFWSIKKMIKHSKLQYSKNHVRVICLESPEKIRAKLEKKHHLAGFIIEYLYYRSSTAQNDAEKSEAGKDDFNKGGDEDEKPGVVTGKAVEEGKGDVLVGFSVNGLKAAYEKSAELFKLKITIADIEDALFYLSRIEAIKIEGGFLVVYNPMTIERLELDKKRRYKVEDYRKLEQFYDNKVQQIHIVGEYARKMLDDYRGALQFVEDYFLLNYSSFLKKYFKESKGEEIRRNITPAKFRKLFGELSPAQLSIIRDSENQYITVLAGPGSGKTRVLVHKLASIVMMEDVKYEQLLMLTFSRAAVNEFKKRLAGLIGNAAHFIEIKTFHSYCFDLLGRMGGVEKLEEIITTTLEKIKSGDVEPGRITKTVLVIDEAQDMDQENFALLQTMMEKNENMRVIAVGDDDQNIFEFRGSSSEYMKRFITENKAAQYELLENYRSKSNLVEFTNGFTSMLRGRLKKNYIMAHSRDNGVIKIVNYSYNNNLITPVAEDIAATELKGSTCVLTHTNDEALQVAGLLLEKGFPARLIHSNDNFSLNDLAELRFFSEMTDVDPMSPVVSDDIWNEAKRALQKKYINSALFEICMKIIKDFESIFPLRKYKTDFQVFIKESRLEHFYEEAREKILVSTIHKAKGREFDNVFLLLKNFGLNTEDKKRQLYVAMTRARSNLTIHLSGSYLKHIRANDMIYTEDRNHYELPGKLAVQLGHGDVWLDYFFRRQSVIKTMQSGDIIQHKDGDWITKEGQNIFRFSRKFEEKLDRIGNNGYEPRYAKVNYIVFWRKKDDGEEPPEIKIVLPELHFERV